MKRSDLKVGALVKLVSVNPTLRVWSQSQYNASEEISLDAKLDLEGVPETPLLVAHIAPTGMFTLVSDNQDIYNVPASSIKSALAPARYVLKAETGTGTEVSKKAEIFIAKQALSLRGTVSDMSMAVTARAVQRLLGEFNIKATVTLRREEERFEELTD